LRRQINLLAAILLVAATASATAECVDLQQPGRLAFEGTLSYRVFAGPPNYEDVRKCDAPEPGYILKLDEPMCAAGDEFVDANDKFDLIQLFPDGTGRAARTLAKELRRLVGRRVSVEGKSAFGAHTGHHHAPLVMPISRIVPVSPPRRQR
jgi:Domain of unknown function (DUF4431)